MGNFKYKGAVFGITAALVFSACTLPALATTYAAATDESMTVVTTDQTYGGGLDLEAQIIMTVEQDQRSPYAKKGIAVVDDYVNIRSEPDEEAKIVGKLYTDSGCDIEEISDGWAHIISGDCEGYVKAKYLLTGTDAEDYASENNVAEVVATAQNTTMYMYAEASAESEIVATIMQDQELTVLGTSEDGQWVEAQSGEDTGYIMAEAVSIGVKYEISAISIEEEQAAIAAAEAEAAARAAAETEAAVEEESEETITDAGAAIEEVKETVWAMISVSIRAEASTDSEKLSVLAGSDNITRTGILDNGWSRVDYNGEEAYIKSEYLTTTEPEDTQAEEDTGTNETVYATTGVNVRAEASVDADRLGTLSVGDSITRTGESGDWSVVDYNGTTGYIKSDYLSTTKPETSASTSSEETVYATTAVNIRAEASSDGEILGVLSKGESITRTGESGDWSVVTYNGTTAYIKSEYLSTTKPETSSDESSSGSSSSSSIEEVNETVYATVGVNIRSEASATSDKLGVLTAGSSITRTGKTSDGWSRVDYNGTTGYIKSDYLTTTKPETSSGSSSSGSSSGSSSSSSSLGQQIADFAVQYVGYPYVYGGNSLTNGVDCSGFTQQVYLHFGYSIPRRASIQATAGTSVSISDLQPGDLVFYGDSSGVGHVAIYIGNQQVVHASNSKTGIIISNLYYRTPLCARRII